MRRMGAHLQVSLNPRKTMDIVKFTRMLNDYPELHGGGIVGLCDKSIRWHRERAAANYSDVLAQYESSTARGPSSPIDLSDYPHIKFLDSAQAIVDEARQMEHCIGEYIPQAMRGDCYLFHIEHIRAHASIMLDSYGRIARADGPRNRSNCAVEYAKQVLLMLWAQQVGALTEGSNKE